MGRFGPQSGYLDTDASYRQLCEEFGSGRSQIQIYRDEDSGIQQSSSGDPGTPAFLLQDAPEQS